MGHCRYCEKVLPPPSTKPRVYCSDACRQADYRARESARDSAASTAYVTRIQELEARIQELEAQNTRLQERLNIEYRLRMDVESRHFKSWLRKQRAYPQGSFAHRFLADTNLPQQASRALFEATLRRLRYSEEDVEAFRDLWRAMLLQA